MKNLVSNMTKFIDNKDLRVFNVDIGLWLLGTCIMRRVARKPVFGISDQVRHKLGCTATEDD